MFFIVQILSPDGQFPLTKAWIHRCRTSMKDFDEVSSAGLEKLAGLIKDKLSS